MFIGRKNELERIKRRLKLDQFQAVLVYGRRRIGKTELINEAIKQSGVEVLPLLARKVNSAINLEEFAADAGRFMNNVSFHPANYYEFYASLFEYSKNHPFVLFIDEYCFLKEGEPSIDTYLQKAIELHKDGAKLSIILCGSYIDVMKQIVVQKAPLYGRFNEEILLHSFDYLDASKFAPTLSNDEKIKYYAVFGGTAFNLGNIDYSKSFEENVIEEFVKVESFFEREALEVIKGEIEKEANVNSIFEYIATGTRKYKELNLKMGDPGNDNIGRYIKKLENMDLVDKSFMVNAKTERRPLYYIKDNMLDFYYTFLSKYSRQRASMSPELFFEKYIKEALYEQYIPRKFEEIVKQYVIRYNDQRIPYFDNVGRLYFNDGDINREFDVVLSCEKGLIPIECKYIDTPLKMSTINEEKKQWKEVPFTVFKYGFAAKSGFEANVKSDKDLLLIQLDDLYN